jgi:hypothetical protein
MENEKNEVLCEFTKEKFDRRNILSNKIIKNIIIKDGIIQSFEYGYLSIPKASVKIIDKNGLDYESIEEEAIKAGCFENYKNGIFFTCEETNNAFKSKDYTPNKSFTKGTDIIKRMCKTKKDLIKYGIYSPSYLLTQNKKYTFGVEIETFMGYVPDHTICKLNAFVTKDGSIVDNKGNKSLPDGNYVGREFVTGVLTGDSGMMHLQEICNELSKRTSVNKSCGLHIHVGSVDFSDEFLVLSYKLGFKLQNEIYKMLPKSRLKNEYCKLLPDLNLNYPKNLTSEEYKLETNLLFKKLFSYYCDGQEPSSMYNRKTSHPRGNNMGYDRSSLRYSWLNLAPCLFNLRNVKDDNGNIQSYTIEFRNHSGTLNFFKIKNWILICFAFVNYIENNKFKIINDDKITIEDLINSCYKGKFAEKLIEYYYKRCKLFNQESEELCLKAEEKDYKNVKNVKNIKIKDLLCV